MLICFGEYKNTFCIIYDFSLLKWCSWLISFLMGDYDLFILQKDAENLELQGAKASARPS